jgi:hypothetical protein
MTTPRGFTYTINKYLPHTAESRLSENKLNDQYRHLKLYKNLSFWAIILSGFAGLFFIYKANFNITLINLGLPGGFSAGFWALYIKTRLDFKAYEKRIQDIQEFDKVSDECDRIEDAKMRDDTRRTLILERSRAITLQNNTGKGN